MNKPRDVRCTQIGRLRCSIADTNNASIFFSLVDYRNSLFTSNKSFSEWGEILGDQVMASAVLDRILHHCTVVNIRGESYRLKDRKKDSLTLFQRSKRRKRMSKILYISREFCSVVFEEYPITTCNYFLPFFAYRYPCL